MRNLSQKSLVGDMVHFWLLQNVRTTFPVLGWKENTNFKPKVNNLKFYLDGAYNLDLLYTASDSPIRYMNGEFDALDLKGS